jgi:nicotinamide riboside transporter PnuC
MPSLSQLFSAAMVSGLMQWSGGIVGLAGVVLLAFNSRLARWGWVACLVSNAIWIGYSVMANANGLLFQQAGLVIANIIGLRRWFFQRPPLESSGP